MKKFLFSVLMFLFVASFASLAGAEAIEYGDGEYENYYDQSTWQTVASISYGEVGKADLRDYWYVTWGLDDLNLEDGQTLDAVNIVFHGISNTDSEVDNKLSVYLFNDPQLMGWNTYHWDTDDSPDWTGTYGATKIGEWTDTNGNGTDNDVVFTTSDATLLYYLTEGGTFGIGIDPDCYYIFDEITVQVPVPEPATMLLLGSGLFGLAGFGRKRFFKKG